MKRRRSRLFCFLFCHCSRFLRLDSHASCNNPSQGGPQSCSNCSVDAIRDSIHIDLCCSCQQIPFARLLFLFRGRYDQILFLIRCSNKMLHRNYRLSFDMISRHFLRLIVVGKGDQECGLQVGHLPTPISRCEKPLGETLGLWRQVGFLGGVAPFLLVYLQRSTTFEYKSSCHHLMFL